MKKIIIAIVIVFLSIFSFQNLNFTKETRTSRQEISLEQYSVHQGNLILVNQDYMLAQDATNLVNIPMELKEDVLFDSDLLLNKALIRPLQQMFEAAISDGVNHFMLNSTYRSGQLQEQLFVDYGASYALPPGYSEHQTGLALDIGSSDGTMDQALESKWLEKNAANFGFILRYPENKMDITGISFEPWHFRYVGLPHSIMIKRKDFAFEEYINYLMTEKEYLMKVNGVTYFVQYVEQAPTVKIPKTQNFNVSGNNINGFIITSIID